MNEPHGWNEQSLLLKPSACSTDKKSGDNLNGDHDDETGDLLKSRESSASPNIQLPLLKKSSWDTKGGSFEDFVQGQNFQKHRCVLVALMVAALTGGIVLVRTALAHRHVGPTYHHHKEEVQPVNPNSRAFSSLDPVKDLGLMDYTRPEGSRPPAVLTTRSGKKKSYPTNAWYLNLILLRDKKPSDNQRAYPMPYVVDTAGPIPGLRVHANHVDASTNEIHVSFVDIYGLTLGAAPTKSEKFSETAFGYNILQTTPLGVTLAWEEMSMQASIVRGMPYGTMQYTNWPIQGSSTSTIYPTIASQIPLRKSPVADGKTAISCDGSKPVLVEHEIELVFDTCDFTWLVFVSEPVMMQCVTDPVSHGMRLQVVEKASDGSKSDNGEDRPLVLRLALWKLCTSGNDPIYCHQEQLHPTALHIGQGEYHEILSRHAGVYPGPNTAFSFETDHDAAKIKLEFDWDVQYMSEHDDSDNITELIAFGLPHHFDMFPKESINEDEMYCAQSLLGPACLVSGSSWTLIEDIPTIGFRAPRPPEAKYLTDIAKSLKDDISYRLPVYFRRGAGDTYFSGKMLAKLGRIILIADELMEICGKDSTIQDEKYQEACKSITLPTQTEFTAAIDQLRSSTEVWINGKAETPFVYDSAWGGVVSCGCLFDGKVCQNIYPDCPSFQDPGLDFGNAYYNDQHFHYGYHIFAASVVAHFDHEWGRKHFENVLLLVRAIANPDPSDEYFTTFRHKDWYQGHSWASGIAVAPPNGRNQESSSEAIAAYEAVSLYGTVMLSAWEEVGDQQKMVAAKSIEEAGQIMTASEARSTKRYWHVFQKEGTVKIYPSSYKPFVIGMLWQTMAQFQTWFGSAAYLAYGIQLLPFTPISELRDGLDWSKAMYEPFAASCDGDKGCYNSGWRILQLGMLATVGHQDLAVAGAHQMKAAVFEDPGGNGHSLTNTLWYISTRPKVEKPIAVNNTEHEEVSTVFDHCGQPATCTDYVLDTIADVYSCRQRIQWLMKNEAKSQKEACNMIAVEEYPKQCGGCNPSLDPNAAPTTTTSTTCPPCSQDICDGPMNRCPRYDHTYLCITGQNHGGCAGSPWELDGSICNTCCELTGCAEASPLAPLDKHDTFVAPACSESVCRSRADSCPSGKTVPYLCLEGRSNGECTPTPWSLEKRDCKKWCQVLPGCRK